MDSLKRLLDQNRANTTKLLSRLKNGRVNIMGTPTSVSAFPLFEETNRGNKIYQNEALKSIIGKTQLHEVFFSSSNIESLQEECEKKIGLKGLL